MLAFFAIFRPLTGNKTSQNYYFLVEQVLSFNLVGPMWKSVKNWLQEWVFNIYKWKLGRSRWIAYFENYLQKWFGDRYGEFPTAFPTRISHKISHKIFPQDFLQDFPAGFPTRFPARFSYKTSRKIFPQDLPARFPTQFSHTIFLQQFPARISRKIFPHNFPATISHKIFLQQFPARFSCKIFLQDFPKLDPDWLAPHHPIPNAKFPPITALLNRPTYHKRSKVSPPPFPKILWVNQWISWL